MRLGGHPFSGTSWGLRRHAGRSSELATLRFSVQVFRRTRGYQSQARYRLQQEQEVARLKAAKSKGFDGPLQRSAANRGFLCRASADVGGPGSGLIPRMGRALPRPSLSLFSRNKLSQRGFALSGIQPGR